MKNFWIVFIVSLGLFQCKSGQDVLPSTANDPFISEIRTDGKLEMAFLYNAQNQVVEIQKYFDDGASLWESTRYFWKNDRLDRSEFWSSHSLFLSSSPKPGKPLTLQNTQTYEHDPQGRIVKQFNYVGANDYRSYTLINYDNLGRKAEEKVFTPEGRETSNSTLIYNNRNNLTQSGNSNWEYDEKPNPFRRLNVPHKNQSWASVNNGTSNFGKDTNGNKSNVWNFEYTYNPENGFPITMKTIIPNWPSRQSVFVYRN